MVLMVRPVLALALGLFLLGCEGTQFRSREAGALSGAALGAGLGAIIGNQTGSTGAGIAIGSAIGGLSGGLIGQSLDSTDDRISATDRRLSVQEREIAENKRLIEELRSRGADARLTDRGVVVNLPDVLFEFDSARLTSGAERTAREIAAVIGRESGRAIAIEGHTDSLGTAAYNDRLSEARAHAVADRLTLNGVSRGRLKVRGYGESRPVATNETREGRQRNRRVEVIIENR
jgi:outer membrane protein OmpA-like peptidoglycan-associated protein